MTEPFLNSGDEFEARKIDDPPPPALLREGGAGGERAAAVLREGRGERVVAAAVSVPAR